MTPHSSSETWSDNERFRASTRDIGTCSSEELRKSPTSTTKEKGLVRTRRRDGSETSIVLLLPSLRSFKLSGCVGQTADKLRVTPRRIRQSSNIQFARKKAGTVRTRPKRVRELRRPCSTSEMIAPDATWPRSPLTQQP